MARRRKARRRRTYRYATKARRRSTGFLKGLLNPKYLLAIGAGYFSPQVGAAVPQIPQYAPLVAPVGLVLGKTSIMKMGVAYGLGVLLRNTFGGAGIFSGGRTTPGMFYYG